MQKATKTSVERIVAGCPIISILWSCFCGRLPGLVLSGWWSNDNVCRDWRSCSDSFCFEMGDAEALFQLREIEQSIDCACAFFDHLFQSWDTDETRRRQANLASHTHTSNTCIHSETHHASMHSAHLL
mmetsp:Transcript_32015/g.66259  ORF Transcript_32015/g.66259 Transcript_32015/m.66259 type:complete len:128 (+) Transcript_32015:556-939(+)